jgi:outer membrane protein assembly factor BamB
MIGGNARHTSSVSDDLPERLHLVWSIRLPPLQAAWPDQVRLKDDGLYRPIVSRGHLIIVSSLDDSVTAYRTLDGCEVWRLFAQGPIRTAPAAADGRVFVGSDDGCVYALGVQTGNLLWKRKTAPRSRPVLGNGRMIDTWAVRGGPVVADGRLHFTAGVWPFMGVFLQCVDPATGTAIWTNSGDGADFLPQPHGDAAFSRTAPCGSIAVIGDRHGGFRRQPHNPGPAGGTLSITPSVSRAGVPAIGQQRGHGGRVGRVDQISRGRTWPRFQG